MADNWLTRMTADPTKWLLDHEDPMIRYGALTWISDRPPEDPRVRAARSEAARHPRLETLLSGQSEQGWWEDPELFVDDYYYGTVWRLYLAAQLGAERSPEIHRGIEFLFPTSQCRTGGGFSHHGDPRRGGTTAGQWSCLTGAILEILFHFGYGADPRTGRALSFLISRQQADGLYPCENFSPNRSTLPLNCYLGSIRPLLAALATPPSLHTPALRILTERTAETLLSYHLYIYKRAPDGRPAGKAEWMRFGFPRFWNTDLLEVAWILARLGYGSRPELQPALRIILNRQLKNGRWRLEHDYNDRMPVSLGRPGVSNPWITLRALHTLKICSGFAQVPSGTGASLPR